MARKNRRGQRAACYNPNQVGLMAVAPRLAAFEIVDLRFLRARSLAALFEDEQREWRDELHWDYRPSVEMIRKHVDAQNLPGYAALSHGQVAGYCFYLYEDEKGMIGDLYVRPPYRQERPYNGAAGIATLLLENALETLAATPVVRRIETQVIPFGTEPLEPVFLAHDFTAFPRLFLYKPLAGAPRSSGPPAAKSPGIKLRGWDDSDFEAMADLVVATYSGHVDSRINDQYSSRAGALRFLKNIVIFPGCGVFQRDSSFVAAEPAGGLLVGALLVSQVAPRVGHITQVSVRREWQGRGLGRRLLEAALDHLAAKGYTGVSLTVTAENHPAVELYRRLVFKTIKEFTAFARTLRR